MTPQTAERQDAQLDGSRAIDREQALAALRDEARGWQGCPLAAMATQLVFGVGPAAAALMFVGEAPGYQEDKQGVPFVGPAGRLLNEGLAQAGLDRATVYVTNVERFRPWTPGGKTGKNRQPKQSEVNACRGWLEREIAIVQPRIICCLGAVAAKWVLGKDFKLTQQRGKWQTSPYAPDVLATLHPAFLLIQPDESRAAVQESFFADLRSVAERLRALPTAESAA